MKLPFPFKSSEPPSSWPWPICSNPKTLSFRAPTQSQPPDMTDSDGGDAAVETVIRGLRRENERMLVELGETSSILEEAKSSSTNGLMLIPFKESVVMGVDSRDPFVDFKRSMEEMVEANGLKDWESLQELLGWYLRVNGKSNHGYIYGAFVDLLVGLAFDDDDDDDTTVSDDDESPTSALSFSYSASSTSHCLSSLEADNGENEKITVLDNASSTPTSYVV